MSGLTIAVGMLATIPVVVLSIDNVNSMASIEVVDNNLNSIAGPANIPLALVKATAPVIAVHDVVQNVSNGLTVVVEWIDPNNPFNFSASANGFSPQSVVGWRKVGTFNG